jgi:hypothetical protein
MQVGAEAPAWRLNSACRSRRISQRSARGGELAHRAAQTCWSGAIVIGGKVLLVVAQAGQR